MKYINNLITAFPILISFHYLKRELLEVDAIGEGPALGQMVLNYRIPKKN